MYGETDTHASAGVVVRVNSTYKDLNGIAGVRACINEYDGIGMAFIFCLKFFVLNILKRLSIFSTLQHPWHS